VSVDIVSTLPWESGAQLLAAILLAIPMAYHRERHSRTMSLRTILLPSDTLINRATRAPMQETAGAGYGSALAHFISLFAHVSIRIAVTARKAAKQRFSGVRSML